MSQHLLSEVDLFGVDEPGKMPVECDRAAITDRCSLQADNGTAEHVTANVRAVPVPIQKDVDRRPGTQPVRRIDERAAGRDVDEPGLMSGPHANLHDAVFFTMPLTRRLPAFRPRRYSGFHCPLTASNFRIRVLPVCP